MGGFEVSPDRPGARQKWEEGDRARARKRVRKWKNRPFNPNYP
jgi:hypothetical protein